MIRKLTAILITFAWTYQGLACPVYFSGASLPKGAFNISRDQWQLFSLPTGSSQGKAQWQKLPLQIDPMDDDGKVLFYKENDPWQTSSLDAKDRLTFREEKFGPAFGPDREFPCQTPFLYELESTERPGQFAYLAPCPQYKNGTSKYSSQNALVKFNPEALDIRSPLYNYYFLKENHMMFTKVDMVKDGKIIPAVRNAAISIRADIKNFFTMDLDHKDLIAELENHRVGEVGILGKMNFYLRFLMFHLDMKMSAIAGFYDDAVHLPMMIDVPVDSRKFMNHGSGFIFSFEQDKSKFNFIGEPREVPLFDAREILAGKTKGKELAQKHCDDQLCFFQIKGRVEAEAFSLLFEIPRPMVEAGFVPLFIPNMGDAKKALAWDDDPKAEDFKRVGLFFSSTVLDKGRYEFNHWIMRGESTANQNLQCPKQVVMKRVIPLPTLAH